jgi:sulfatase modifying factor 1
VSFLGEPPTDPEDWHDIDQDWIIVHPDYENWTGDPKHLKYEGKDLALLRLSSPVLNISPAARFQANTPVEVGQTARIVGFGYSGDGSYGALSLDRRRRAGDNLISALGPDYIPPPLIPSWSILLMLEDFDAPNDPSASEFAPSTPLQFEFHPNQGDSGGPWFVDVGGEWQVAGVSSFVWPRDDCPEPCTRPPGLYGELGAAVRVSPFNFWIDTYVQHEKRWKDPVNGMWTYDGNWDFESPHEYQAAVFDTNGAYTVTMPSSVTTEQLRVESGSDLTLDGNFTYAITEHATVSTGGALRLDAGATVDVGELRVGEYGTGTLSQSGGDVHITGDLYLGMTAGSVGTYQLIDGSLTVDGNVHGRLLGTDELIVDAPAGAVDIAGDIQLQSLVVGKDAYDGVISTFDITHGSVTCDSVTVGLDGTGQITQIGGTVIAEQTLYIGVNCGANGTYNLAGGALIADTINIAFNGHGELNWTGGTIEPFTPGGTVTVNVWSPNGVFNIGAGLTFTGIVNELTATDADSDGVFDACDDCPDTIAGADVDSSGCPAAIGGDSDRDGDIDLHDIAEFQLCFGPAPTGECQDSFDLDGDGDVDDADWTALAPVVGGAGATPNLPPQGMVLIPAGAFQMGDTFSEGNTSERPVHAVYLDAFYIDAHEVTNQEYAAALNWARSQNNLITVTSGVVYKYNTGTSYPYCDTTTSSSYSRITWNGSTFGVVAGKEDHPVVMVSWYGSVAYANWRSAMEGRQLCYDLSTWTCNFGSGYRLPTEAEWEKAARGGSPGHRFPWSDTDTIQHARANYRSYWSGGAPYYDYDTSPTEGYHPTFNTGVYPYTSPVGYFAWNGYGLYDMAGNVLEWCNDWYSSTYYQDYVNAGSPPNPHGPTTAQDFRVLRGGSWGYNSIGCRVAFRLNYRAPYFRVSDFGFRLALDSE